MSTSSKSGAFAPPAILIAAPAFEDQRVKPTQHSAFAGGLASLVNPSGGTPQLNSAAREQKPEPRLPVGRLSPSSAKLAKRSKGVSSMNQCS
jgi:hypothetical protein